MTQLINPSLFRRKVHFITGAVNTGGFPPHDGVEIALLGRSNVGKSSLLNALVGQKALARVSNTPGRTRQLNFFLIDDKLMLVDLPGYGYSRVSKNEAATWQQLIVAYLNKRPHLRVALVLIDSRRGLMKSDLQVLQLLATNGTACQIILTKTDKISSAELAKVRQQVSEQSQAIASCYPDIICTSSRKRQGIDAVQQTLLQLLTPL